MHLLRRIELYLRDSNTPPTRFGRESVHDPRFVFDLRMGREPRPPTRQRVSDYLDRREAQLGGAR